MFKDCVQEYAFVRNLALQFCHSWQPFEKMTDAEKMDFFQTVEKCIKTVLDNMEVKR